MPAFLASPLARWIGAGLLAVLVIGGAVAAINRVISNIEQRGVDRATLEWSFKLSAVRLQHMDQIAAINAAADARQRELQDRVDRMAAFSTRLADEQDADEAALAELSERLRKQAHAPQPAPGPDARPRRGLSAEWVRLLNQIGTPGAVRAAGANRGAEGAP